MNKSNLGREHDDLSRRDNHFKPRWSAMSQGVRLLKQLGVVASLALAALLAPLLVPSLAEARPQAPASLDSAALLTVVNGVPGSTQLRLSVTEQAYSLLSSHQSVTLTQFPLKPGANVNLELERFWIWGPGTRFVIGTNRGDVPMPVPSVIFFRGIVSGDPASTVYLSASPSGMNALIRVGQSQHILASAGLPQNPAMQGLHTIFDALSLDGATPPSPFQCEPALAPGQVPPVGTPPSGPQAGAISRVALVAVEADHEFRLRFSDAASAAQYVCELFAVVSTIYEADVNMKLAVSFVRIWDTSADPYNASGSGDQLVQFKDFWNANMGSVQRNVAHMISGRNLGGGTAYLDQMCGGGFAYGVSGNMTGSFPRPAQDGQGGNWDIYVTAHEMGHNFRSPHTHCYVPPVDFCQTSNGGTCAQGTRVCQQGTIMSYCHLCPGGVANIDLTFGSTVSSFILGGLQSCIAPARNPCFVNRNFGGTEQGTSSNPYRTITKGTWYVVPGASVNITAGSYPEQLLICQPMRLVATGGSVRIGN